MFEVEVKDGAVPGLARIVAGTRSARPLMRMIAGTLGDITEGNFAAQGRPKWLGLKPATLKRRGADAKILQDSGRLATSIATDYGGAWSRVGSNVVYAAIHQFGGQTAPHVILPRYKKALAFGGRVVKKVNHPGSNIPPRPYLPADAQGKLQPEAAIAIDSDVQTYLRSLVD